MILIEYTVFYIGILQIENSLRNDCLTMCSPQSFKGCLGWLWPKSWPLYFWIHFKQLMIDRPKLCDPQSLSKFNYLVKTVRKSNLDLWNAYVRKTLVKHGVNWPENHDFLRLSDRRSESFLPRKVIPIGLPQFCWGLEFIGKYWLAIQNGIAKKWLNIQIFTLIPL